MKAARSKTSIISWLAMTAYLCLWLVYLPLVRAFTASPVPVRKETAAPAKRIVVSSGSSFKRGIDEVLKGNYGKAVEILSASYPAQGANPSLLFNLAFSHQRLGNRQEAIRFYEELLRVEPNHTKGHFNLAYAYLGEASSGEWSRSARHFEKVRELDPKYTEAIFHLATAYWKLDRKQEAEATDRLYLELGAHQDLRQTSRERISKKPDD